MKNIASDAVRFGTGANTVWFVILYTDRKRFFICNDVPSGGFNDDW